jgi:hypothetical protein
MVHYLHHVPGRLRVRLAMLKHNQPAVTRLRTELLAIAGVESASINSVTGSVIIHYNRECFELETFWSTLRQLGHAGELPVRA